MPQLFPIQPLIPNYLTGANYPVGSMFVYLGTIWQVGTAINNAPATPPQGSIAAIGRWMDQGVSNTHTPADQYQLAFGYNGTIDYPTFLFTGHSAGSANSTMRIQINDGVQAMAANAANYTFEVTGEGYLTLRNGASNTRRLYVGANQIQIGAVGTGAIGSAGTPVISFGTDNDTGLYHSGEGIIDFSSNGTRRVSIGGDLSVISGGVTIYSANTRIRSSGNGGQDGPSVQWQQANAEALGQIYFTQSGAIVGGNAEGAFQLMSMNGGYGFQRVFNSTVNSPPQTQWNGALNGPAFNVTSSAAIKQNIVDLVLPNAEDVLMALRARQFEWVPPIPVDENGVPLPNPTPYPVRPQVYGFVIEELATIPELASLLNFADAYDTAPTSYDLGQLLAVTIVGLQHQTRKLRRAMRRIRRLEQAAGLPAPLDMIAAGDDLED